MTYQPEIQGGFDLSEDFQDIEDMDSIPPPELGDLFAKIEEARKEVYSIDASSRVQLSADVSKLYSMLKKARKEHDDLKEEIQCKDATIERLEVQLSHSQTLRENDQKEFVKSVSEVRELYEKRVLDREERILLLRHHVRKWMGWALPFYHSGGGSGGRSVGNSESDSYPSKQDLIHWLGELTDEMDTFPLEKRKTRKMIGESSGTSLKGKRVSNHHGTSSSSMMLDDIRDTSSSLKNVKELPRSIRLKRSQMISSSSSTRSQSRSTRFIMEGKEGERTTLNRDGARVMRELGDGDDDSSGDEYDMTRDLEELILESRQLLISKKGLRGQEMRREGTYPTKEKIRRTLVGNKPKKGKKKKGKRRKKKKKKVIKKKKGNKNNNKTTQNGISPHPPLPNSSNSSLSGSHHRSRFSQYQEEEGEEEEQVDEEEEEFYEDDRPETLSSREEEEEEEDEFEDEEEDSEDEEEEIEIEVSPGSFFSSSFICFDIYFL